MANKLSVFIHTNDQQIVGALVGAFSMRQASRAPEAFDIKLVRLEETDHLSKRQGQTYLRKGRQAIWHNEDLQSFSPLRRMIPQLMGFEGRAVVTDPDVFAVGDIYDLLTMDMGGKAILCRRIADGYKGNGNPFYASSVMLLDCTKLRHWRWDCDIDDIFAGKLDYGPWIGLATEDPRTIGEIGEEWNSFDTLDAPTQLLHMTERSTQPWKTGLPVDYDLNIRSASSAGLTRMMQKMWTLAKGRRATTMSVATHHYKPHPDPKQERFFFQLLKDALEAGAVDEGLLRNRMLANDIRPDAVEILQSIGYRSSPGNVSREDTSPTYEHS